MLWPHFHAHIIQHTGHYILNPDLCKNSISAFAIIGTTSTMHSSLHFSENAATRLTRRPHHLPSHPPPHPHHPTSPTCFNLLAFQWVVSLRHYWYVVSIAGETNELLFEPGREVEQGVVQGAGQGAGQFSSSPAPAPTRLQGQDLTNR